MKKIPKILRIFVSTITFVGGLLLFLDFSGGLAAYLDWIARIQLVPAILSLNLGVLIVLAVLTLLFGRVYCSMICPLGTAQDLFALTRSKKSKYRFVRATPLRRVLRYSLLALFAFSLGFGIMCCVGVFDPYSAFGRMISTLFAPVIFEGYRHLVTSTVEAHGMAASYSPSIWLAGMSPLVTAGVTFLVLGVTAVLTGRGYCTSVCPVGAFLGLISKLSIFRIQIDASKCKNCSACANKCSAHCLDVANHRVDTERCLLCMNCLAACKAGAVTYAPSLKAMLARQQATRDGIAESCTPNMTAPILLNDAATNTQPIQLSKTVSPEVVKNVTGVVQIPMSGTFTQPEMLKGATSVLEMPKSGEFDQPAVLKNMSEVLPVPDFENDSSKDEDEDNNATELLEMPNLDALAAAGMNSARSGDVSKRIIEAAFNELERPTDAPIFYDDEDEIKEIVQDSPEEVVCLSEDDRHINK